ncbi:gamma-butyrobetaine hydroxylase-like domain-containing protein [Tautonia plasticadhaerens]|uniref:Gamma-butyrobetaine hydroxylase-like N-terminal domain-containing protein n=1 Tax=Tautonia plasticadhaerens TaxID=2527974 RepID=A0A518H8H1_9BACT|nr:DUF971 domain-containing protein [Tautonia plasticadhaerens]QDV37138.1 hypothetical protein ElP_50710 [Tautonia plasticadhaerens]
MSEPPTDIRAHQGEQALELAWDDVGASLVPYRFIRSECPCASCKDEWTGERILDPGSIRPDLRIESMEPIGNYAVRLAWDDGHSSGLYTWTHLRNLADRHEGRAPSPSGAPD